MRNPKWIVALMVALFAAMLPALGAAQTRERFGISAKAGGVNAVVGRVMVTRGEVQPQMLSSTDNLAAGETVTSGASSNAEVLLNPGSYFRLGENSEFQFEDVSLDHLRVRLVKGSAIIEATGVADMDLGIKVETVHGEFTIIRSGIYRIDVQPDSAELAVQKGRASFGLSKTDVIKGGKVVNLTNGAAVVSKLHKDKDNFDTWSKQRAELLAKANSRLLNKTFNGYLASYRGWDSWFWSSRSAGLWTYSARFGCYTFMPFYFGWASPYGSYYGSYYWGGGGCCGYPGRNLYPRDSNPTNGGTIVSSGTPGSTGGVTPSSPGPINSAPSGPRISPTIPAGMWNPNSGRGGGVNKIERDQ